MKHRLDPGTRVKVIRTKDALPAGVARGDILTVVSQDGSRVTFQTAAGLTVQLFRRQLEPLE